MKQNPRCVVFDFDGTLVDSAPGILASMGAVLADHRITAQVELRPEIIGPPLPETLRLISGEQDPRKLAALAADFKRRYDSAGYRDTAVYSGIPTMLDELVGDGFRLDIVTNKRGVPTRKILDHLGWSALFAATHCLDEFAGCADKAALLGHLLAARQLPAAAPYVGDTDADARAAAANGLPFLRAGWGYGAIAGDSAQQVCTLPEQVRGAVRAIIEQAHPCPAH